MRRLSALVFAALLSVTIAVPAGAATTIQVRAFIKENFQRAPSDIPCEFTQTSVTCFGRGNAGRFGPITSVVVFTETTTTRTITFRDGSTITLAETWDTFANPGNSFNAPGAEVSFGNPLFGSGTFEVIGATGSLTGVTGFGNLSQVLAGNTIQIWFDATITRP